MATVLTHPPAFALPATSGFDPTKDLKTEPAQNPLPRGTLGDMALATNVTGPADFPLTILIQPFDPNGIVGLDPGTVRVFYWDAKAGALKPVWNSGVNVELGYVWSKIRRPGIYVPIGLPRDPVFREALAAMARERLYASTDSADEMKAITQNAVSALLAVPDQDLADVRKHLAIAHVHTAQMPVPPQQLQFGRGRHVLAFALPQNVDVDEFKARLKSLDTPPGGLPEEALFMRPEIDRSLTAVSLEPDFIYLKPWPLPFPICLLLSKDWYMYHADRQHTGDAKGCSNIRSTNVGSMTLKHAVPVDATISSIPSIVKGKIYVGTGHSLYKIDLASGVVEHIFAVGSRPAYQPGIGGSPAIVDGKVYFTAVPGWVYCLDANTFALQWVTDLRNADPAHNQPVTNPHADSWSGPLVVNGKVFVGCGEGEENAFGFVYCLNASNGHVKWLFCTDKFGPGDNSPNVIPKSAVGISPLPPGFSSHADPATGVSVWSSPAYDAANNRIFVGTGNSTAGDFDPNPDVPYGSGVLSLDAHTGAFHGFFSPPASDSYRPNDTDVDVCGSPTIFTHGGKTVVAIGSKSGAVWLLDATNVNNVLARRNMLPYDAITHAPLPNVDPHAGPSENFWGVFGTPAVHFGLKRLFVGIGGYGGIGDIQTTPFMRALHWNNLNDAWATHVDTIGANHVSRYTVPRPPMYTTNEAGLSSPAVVNDVVFVSTNKPGLYALCANTGLCLWQGTGLAAGFILGPAIYDKYVVVGDGSQVNIYSL
jgi:outer membrane protein assembly factor BamB